MKLKQRPRQRLTLKQVIVPYVKAFSVILAGSIITFIIFSGKRNVVAGSGAGKEPYSVDSMHKR